jgi:hypothetical protein
MIRRLALSLLIPAITAIALPAMAETSLKEQNQAMFQQMRAIRGLTDKEMRAIEMIFAASGYVGQGNPAISEHADTQAACQARLDQQHVRYANPEFERICGAKYMAPLYDPKTETPQQAKVCIDQFEYPDIPCTYPSERGGGPHGRHP